MNSNYDNKSYNKIFSCIKEVSNECNLEMTDYNNIKEASEGYDNSKNHIMEFKAMTPCYLTRLSDKAIVPKLGSKYAAAYDVCACIDDDITILPGECRLIDTGWSIQPPEGFCVYLMPRSGLATKRGLRLANSIGLCDWDYRGEYKVALYNDSKEPQTIHNGDRIAQMMFVPYYQVEFKEVDNLSTTVRGADGFGSTGIK